MLVLPFTVYRATPLCPVCGRSERLVRHHCHLEDLVELAIRSSIACHADYATLAAARRWRRLRRVRDLLRFSPARICAHCNGVDAADPSSRGGGRWLSLSVQELRVVRDGAGSRLNRGPGFRQAVRQVRAVARLDYEARVWPAIRLGRETAADFRARAAPLVRPGRAVLGEGAGAMAAAPPTLLAA